MTFFFVAFLLILFGLFLLRQGRRLHVSTGLPAGEVIYSDMGAWEEVEKPLRSRRWGLIGRPDYLVRVKEGRRTMTVPVEVKSRTAPSMPYEGHVLQLAAYCLLVEDNHKARPPYGMLHYADKTLKIPFTDSLRRQVLDMADDLRSARRAADVHRQHEEAGRCRGCGYIRACGAEALVD